MDPKSIYMKQASQAGLSTDSKRYITKSNSGFPAAQRKATRQAILKRDFQLHDIKARREHESRAEALAAIEPNYNSAYVKSGAKLKPKYLGPQKDSSMVLKKHLANFGQREQPSDLSRQDTYLSDRAPLRLDSFQADAMRSQLQSTNDSLAELKQEKKRAQAVTQIRMGDKANSIIKAGEVSLTAELAKLKQQSFVSLPPFGLAPNHKPVNNSMKQNYMQHLKRIADNSPLFVQDVDSTLNNRLLRGSQFNKRMVIVDSPNKEYMKSRIDLTFPADSEPSLERSDSNGPRKMQVNKDSLKVQNRYLSTEDFRQAYHDPQQQKASEVRFTEPSSQNYYAIRLSKGAKRSRDNSQNSLGRSNSKEALQFLNERASE